MMEEIYALSNFGAQETTTIVWRKAEVVELSDSDKEQIFSSASFKLLPET